VEVNGRVVQTATAGETSEMLVPVEAGLSRVQVTFIRTWDREAGGWISAVTVFLLSLAMLVPRAREAHSKMNSR
jgi:hypothetical protein